METTTTNTNNKQRETLADPDNYALAATCRLLLSNATTLRGYVQCDGLRDAPASLARWRAAGGGGLARLKRPGARRRAARERAAGAGDTGGVAAETQAAAPLVPSSGDSAGGSAGANSSGSGSGSGSISSLLQLRQRLPDGYELAADLAVNEPAVDGVRAAVVTPLRLSVDVAPRPTQRARPLLYRFGAHGALAPSAVDSAGGAAPGSHPVLAAHVQGALALAGGATLWQAGSRPWQRRGKAAAGGGASVPAPATAADAGGSPRLGITPLTLGADEVGGGVAGANSSGIGNSGSSPARGGSAAASEAGEDAGKAGARRHARKPRRARSDTAAAPPSSSSRLVAPGAVQDGLQQTTWRLERLRTDLQSWAERARGGELLGGGGKRRGGDGRPGGCWSSFLPAPHLRVSGLVGVAGRVPLPRSHFDAPGGGGGGGSGGTALNGGGAGRGCAGPGARRLQGGGGGERAADGGLAAHADAMVPPAEQQLTAAAASGGGGSAGGPTAGNTAAALAARLRRFGDAGRAAVGRAVAGGVSGVSGFGSHLARDASARLFASGAASLQLGSMRRALLDFTRLDAAVDAGLTGPRVGVGGAPASGAGAGAMAAAGVAGGGGSGQRHPAFALDDGGVWHALTLSACQQLVGPLRLRADWRFALDSAVPLTAPAKRASGGGGGGGGGAGSGNGAAAARPLLAVPQSAVQLARHVGGMRPALLDAAYGVDAVVPGSGGLVRAVAWYSPRRGEGGLELRLL